MLLDAQKWRFNPKASQFDVLYYILLKKVGKEKRVDKS